MVHIVRSTYFSVCDQVADIHWNLQGAVRILKPGQRASIWLELLMPDVNGDVFQVCCPMQYQLQRMCCCSTEHCMQALCRHCIEELDPLCCR